jgi:hypothetical protein
MRQGTVQAQGTDSVNKGTELIHSFIYLFNLRARFSLLVLSLLVVSCHLKRSIRAPPPAGTCTLRCWEVPGRASVRRASQSKAPPQFVLHHTVAVIAKRSARGAQHQMAGEGHRSPGGHPERRAWLAMLPVASTAMGRLSILFHFLGSGSLAVSCQCQHLCLVRSRARPKVGCRQGLTGLLAR